MIPSKNIVDRLISKYFSYMEVAPGLSTCLLELSLQLIMLVIIHVPTFQKKVPILSLQADGLRLTC
jgi:hypothetical protein